MLDKLPSETEVEFERTEALALADRIVALAEVGIWALIDRDYTTVGEALADVHEKALKARKLLRGTPKD